MCHQIVSLFRKLGKRPSSLQEVTFNVQFLYDIEDSQDLA